MIVLIIPYANIQKRLRGVIWEKIIPKGIVGSGNEVDDKEKRLAIYGKNQHEVRKEL